MQPFRESDPIAATGCRLSLCSTICSTRSLQHRSAVYVWLPSARQELQFSIKPCATTPAYSVKSPSAMTRWRMCGYSRISHPTPLRLLLTRIYQHTPAARGGGSHLGGKLRRLMSPRVVWKQGRGVSHTCR
ncbi:hypothetical protein VTI74DRAFT_5365 [Chaetomium olivicolor]